MSSPYTGSYEIDEAAITRRVNARRSADSAAQRQERRRQRERERQRLQAERARRQQEQDRRLEIAQWAASARDVEARLRVLAKEVLDLQRAYPGRIGATVEVATPRSTSDVEALREFVRTGRAAIAAAEADLGKARSELSAEESLKRIRGQSPGGLDEPRKAADVLAAGSMTSPAPSGRQEPNDPMPALRDAVRSEVRGFLDETRSPLPPNVVRIAEEALNATEAGAAASAFAELRLALTGQKAQRRADQAKAKELLAQFLALDTAEFGDIRARLEAVVNGDDPWTQELGRAVAQARRRKEEVLEEEASRIVREGFEQLGYTVEGIDATLLVTGGEAFLRRPEWDEKYFVRMHVGERDRKLDFQVVRAEAEGALRTADEDARTQKRWCEDFALAERAWRDEGFRTTCEHRQEPGASDVARIRPDDVPETLRQRMIEHGDHAGDAPSQARRSE